MKIHVVFFNRLYRNQIKSNIILTVETLPIIGALNRDSFFQYEIYIWRYNPDMLHWALSSNRNLDSQIYHTVYLLEDS